MGIIFIVALDNGGCARWRVEYGWIHGGFIDREIAVASKSSADNVICRPNLEFLLFAQKMMIKLDGESIYNSNQVMYSHVGSWR